MAPAAPKYLSVTMARTDGANRVIYHAHTTTAIALTFVLPLESEVFTRELWENLNPDNKISLFVRYTNLETRKYQQRILNKHSK